MLETMSDKLSLGLQTTVIGMGIVFLVLIGLSLLILLQSKVIAGLYKNSAAAGAQANAGAAVSIPAAEPALQPVYDKSGTATGEAAGAGIKDAKTAAVIMAAVSEEVNIPLTQLKIKSIKKI